MSEQPTAETMACPCYRCMVDRQEIHDGEVWMGYQFMVVCETCGNKRCPHATYHGEACTGSNDAGQKGSRYE